MSDKTQPITPERIAEMEREHWTKKREQHSLSDREALRNVVGGRDHTGHPGRECGEHRTTGGRAWCHDCSEWCYRAGPCKGCELPQLRERIAELEAREVCPDCGERRADHPGDRLCAWPDLPSGLPEVV